MLEETRARTLEIESPPKIAPQRHMLNNFMPKISQRHTLKSICEQAVASSGMGQHGAQRMGSESVGDVQRTMAGAGVPQTRRHGVKPHATPNVPVTSANDAQPVVFFIIKTGGGVRGVLPPRGSRRFWGAKIGEFFWHFANFVD